MLTVTCEGEPRGLRLCIAYKWQKGLMTFHSEEYAKRVRSIADSFSLLQIRLPLGLIQTRQFGIQLRPCKSGEPYPVAEDLPTVAVGKNLLMQRSGVSEFCLLASE